MTHDNTDDIDTVFALRDACMQEHPEIEEMLQRIAWFAWIERRLHPYRLIERHINNGDERVTEHDRTPYDPKPEVKQHAW